MARATESNIKPQIVFDLSLMVPPSNVVCLEMQKDESVEFMLTQTMHETLFGRHKERLPWLLQLWGISPTEAQLITLWMDEKNAKSIFKTTRIGPHFRQFGSEYLVGPLRNQINAEELVQFVNEEICLALEHRIPIFCTQTSSWKIVEVLQKMGAKVLKKIIEYGETKKSMFRDEKVWKKIASIAVGSALVWIFGGPTAGLTSLGAGGFTIGIEDP